MKDRITASRFARWLGSKKWWQALSGHRFFGKFFNYEFIAYVIAGVLTTLVNYVVYFLMPRFESGGLDIVLANTVAFIAAVLFAFVVNKIFVFDSPSWDGKTVFREFVPFLTCRLLSWGLETVLLYVTVTIFHWNETLMKILLSIIVLLLNYLAGKFLIFRKKADAVPEGEGNQGESHDSKAE